MKPENTEIRCGECNGILGPDAERYECDVCGKTACGHHARWIPCPSSGLKVLISLQCYAKSKIGKR